MQPSSKLQSVNKLGIFLRILITADSKKYRLVLIHQVFNFIRMQRYKLHHINRAVVSY